MGAINKKKLGILLILLGHLIYFYGFRKIDDPRIEIYYNYHSYPGSQFKHFLFSGDLPPKLSYYYFLGILPPKYNRKYEEKNIFEKDQCRLININRLDTPNYQNYIIYQNQTGSYLLKNSDSLFYKIEGVNDLISSQIDLNIFNMFINCKGVVDEAQIANEFFYLSSTIGGDDSYEAENDPLPPYIVIQKRDYFDFIQKYSRESFLNRIDEGLIFNPESFQFNQNTSYCWFKNWGIIRFNFEFNDKTVVKVTDTFLGYTGAELY